MSYHYKAVLVWIMCLFTWPLSVLSIIGYKLFDSEEMFGVSAKTLSLIPGKIGQYLRTSFYIYTLDSCKYDLAVGFASYFAHPNASAGRKVVIGSFSIIGTVELGDFIFISSRVSILSGKYQHAIMDGAADSGSEVNYKPIRIGSNTWLGEGCIVMADIAGQGTVSAGSVVTKEMPSNVTAIGNPARFLKNDYNS